MMIPYPHTKAWGQVPCEEVAMRIPLPECWIYQVDTEFNCTFSWCLISRTLSDPCYYTIYGILLLQFRTEKHHVSLSQLAVGNLNLGTRMGSVKSAHRRAGKVREGKELSPN